MTREIFNGEAADPVWQCGGFEFRRVADYPERVNNLPRLGGSSNGVAYPAIPGEHVVTFVSEAVDGEAERGSVWLEGGSALDDVVALWSFAGGVPVHLDPARRLPTADERSYVIAEPSEIVHAVKTAYGACRKRPVDRRVKSALITYLEIAHVRWVQFKAVLVASVLECLAPIGKPRSDAADSDRYRPIVERLAALPAMTTLDIPRESLEEIVVALYRVRNAFLHGGIFPPKDALPLGSVKTTTIRVVNVARILAKLAVADAMKFPTLRAGKKLGNDVKVLLTTGSFIPAHVAELLAALEAAADTEDD